MPLPLTSKDKSARLDWGYHARPAPLAGTRRRLWLLAAAVAVPLLGLAGWAVADRPPTPLAVAASRGTLVHAHSMWDQQCEACHTPFEPIAGGAAKCQTCHAAAAHHPAQKPDEVAGCAACHRDHQGRDHRLKHAADATCTGCHADLNVHHTGTPVVAAKVSGFATDHPEFRNNPSDAPGPFVRTLKFGHAVHVSASPMMDSYLAQMSPAERERYTPVVDAMRTGDKAAVCGSCHAFDAHRPGGAKSPLSLAEVFSGRPLGGLPVEAILPPRAPGAHPLPITFEAHCAACHPLTFDPADGLRGVSAPHRVPPGELERFLRRAYTERLVTVGLAGGEPNRGPGRLDPPIDEATRGQIDRRTADAGRMLAATCGKCHTSDTAGGFLKTNTPTVWQPRARFDHPSHRMTRCQDCHPAAFGTDQTAPDLPTLQSCQKCHAPAGGAGHGCTDCHQYHHADRRLQGRGSL